MRPVSAELDTLDVVAELVRHPDRVADEVAVHSGPEGFAGHAAMMPGRYRIWLLVGRVGCPRLWADSRMRA